MPRQALHRRPIEEISIVLPMHHQALVRRIQHRHRQIELRKSQLHLHRNQVQIWKLHSTQRSVLPGQHHLEKGGMTQGSVGFQLLHQPFEGHMVVVVGSKARLSHPIQERREARRAPEVSAQYQSVHEEADQPLRLDPRATGHRRTHREIPSMARTPQKHLEGSQHRHEGRHSLRTTPAPQSLRLLRRPTATQGASRPMVRPLPWTIRRQFQNRHRTPGRRSPQNRAPVVQL